MREPPRRYYFRGNGFDLTRGAICYNVTAPTSRNCILVPGHLVIAGLGCSMSRPSVRRCRYFVATALDSPVCWRGRCRRSCGGSCVFTRSDERHRNDGAEQRQYAFIHGLQIYMVTAKF